MAAVEASHSSICITDALHDDNPIVYANPAFEKLTGYARDEVVGRNCRFLQGVDRNQPGVADLRAAISNGDSCRTELRNYRKDGTLFWNELYVAPIPGEDGRAIAFVGVQNDITERKALERQSGERYFQTLIEHISDVIVVVAVDGSIQYISGAARATLGRAPEALVGTNLLGLLTSEDARRLLASMTGPLQLPGQTASLTGIKCRHADGSWRVLEISVANRSDNTWVQGFVLNCCDVTERQTYLEQLRHQALHDSLTGLPNRALFEDRLQHSIERAREDHTPLVLLLIDIEQFKDVNAALGHRVGDWVLNELGRRLRECARPADTIGRLGGDEFALMAPGAGVDASQLARVVQAALAEPVRLETGTLQLGASVGIATFPEHGEDAASLLRHAEAAVHTARQLGNGFAVYSPEDGQHSIGRLTLMSELREAIPRGDLILHFQPKVHLGTGRVVSTEALVRWQHPTRGLLYPDAFISLAEETGVIEQLTLAVLEMALRECALWHRLGYGVSCAVNISARSLDISGFLDQILAFISRSGVPSEAVILEVTESALMANLPVVRERLQVARLAGAHISIDDFGTGYSSLAQLRHLPVDEIKIDRSLVRDVANSAQDAAIVRAVVELGHSLDLTVVAEGVEDESTLDALRSLGCDVAQGYFLARPMPVERLQSWMATSPYGWGEVARPLHVAAIGHATAVEQHSNEVMQALRRAHASL